MKGFDMLWARMLREGLRRAAPVAAAAISAKVA
jgi:hypothetical protein